VPRGITEIDPVWTVILRPNELWGRGPKTGNVVSLNVLDPLPHSSFTGFRVPVPGTGAAPAP